MADQQQNIQKDKALRAMIDALEASGRKSLEREVQKYRLKRANGNVLMMDCYKKKLYKAILELRRYNQEMEDSRKK